MKRLILALALLLAASPAFAQSYTAYRIRHGATVPAVCDPNRGEVFYVTTLATRGIWNCVDTNTWAQLAGSVIPAGMTAPGISVTGAATALTLTRTDAGHVHLVMTNPAGSVDWGVGAAGEAHIDVGVGKATNFRVAGADVLTVNEAGGLVFAGLTQATLGTPANGTMIYCSDCTFANPCAGGGTGAIAKRLNGAWRCD